MHAFASLALVAISALPAVLAHAGISNLYINGQNQGDAVCLRMNSNPSTWSNPVENLSSSDMACGVTGTKGVNRVCPVPDGATLTFEWRETANKPGGGVLDISHMGPCAVYMKHVDAATTDGAAGNGWFKIWHEGYDEKTQEWCTKKLINNGGFLSVPVPQGLAGGEYLVRAELLALHEANHGDPQYYIGCAQIFLQSAGNLLPASTVSIPGYVSTSDKADSFNIYNKPLALPYPPPGPAVAGLKAGVSVNIKAVQQAAGSKPDGCILESGSNFCGIEVPSYSNEAGCYKSSENCWEQASACYASAPPTGDIACEIWEKRCGAIQNDCGSGRAGPPNKGKVLTPAKKNLASIPAPLGPVEHLGVADDAPASSDPSPTVVASPEKASGVSAPLVSSPATASSCSSSKRPKTSSKAIRYPKGRPRTPRSGW